MDWRQLWEICSAPDNVPIVGLIPLLCFYIYLAWKQAHANDQLIAELEADPAMAKTHHRKTQPFKTGWTRDVHVWPYLLRIEFLAAIIVTVILMVWSITLNAPLEEPANPTLTIFGVRAGDSCMPSRLRFLATLRVTCRDQRDSTPQPVCSCITV